MKKFFLKLIKTIILIYGVVFVVSMVIDWQLSQPNACDNNTWQKLFDGEINSDIVIIGNSRAEAHYDPQIFQEITGFKTYNLGLSGTPFNVIKIRWDALMQRNKRPAVVIFDLDVNIFAKSDYLFQKFQYLPYTRKKEFKTVASELDRDYWPEQLLPLYKYRSNEMNVIKMLQAVNNEKLCSEYYNGYLGHDIQWIERDWVSFQAKLVADQKVEKYNLNRYDEGFLLFHSMIQECLDSGTKVYMVWSPTYYESSDYLRQVKDFVDDKLIAISKQYSIPYCDYSNIDLSKSKENFYNQAHLNRTGAIKFSKKIATQIKEDLFE